MLPGLSPCIISYRAGIFNSSQILILLLISVTILGTFGANLQINGLPSKSGSREHYMKKLCKHLLYMIKYICQLLASTPYKNPVGVHPISLD